MFVTALQIFFPILSKYFQHTKTFLSCIFLKKMWKLKCLKDFSLHFYFNMFFWNVNEEKVFSTLKIFCWQLIFVIKKYFKYKKTFSRAFFEITCQIKNVQETSFFILILIQFFENLTRKKFFLCWKYILIKKSTVIKIFST